jgi:hypothetical protein
VSLQLGESTRAELSHARHHATGGSEPEVGSIHRIGRAGERNASESRRRRRQAERTKLPRRDLFHSRGADGEQRERR